jgi:hypothetical protein
MAKKFADLVAKMSPEAHARHEERHRRLVEEMHLHKLRQAKAMSQAKLAESLKRTP